MDFQKKNTALLIKFLDKFYNKVDTPWVQLVWKAYYNDKVPHVDNLRGSYWWKDIMKLVDNFRSVAFVRHGTGDTFLFWTDSWKLDGPVTTMKSRFPRLCSYALNEDVSAATVFAAVDDLPSLFHLPLSQQAFVELDNLKNLLLQHPLSQESDVWSFC